MSLAILFHFFYAQHVSGNNTSISRSLRLFYCITTLVVYSSFETPTHIEPRTIRPMW